MQSTQQKASSAHRQIAHAHTLRCRKSRRHRLRHRLRSHPIHTQIEHHRAPRCPRIDGLSRPLSDPAIKRSDRHFAAPHRHHIGDGGRPSRAALPAADPVIHGQTILARTLSPGRCQQVAARGMRRAVSGHQRARDSVLILAISFVL